MNESYTFFSLQYMSPDCEGSVYLNVWMRAGAPCCLFFTQSETSLKVTQEDTHALTQMCPATTVLLLLTLPIFTSNTSFAVDNRSQNEVRQFGETKVLLSLCDLIKTPHIICLFFFCFFFHTTHTHTHTVLTHQS